jgi:TPR repeat protein
MGAGQSFLGNSSSSSSNNNNAAKVFSVGKTEIPADDAFFSKARDNNQTTTKARVINTPLLGVPSSDSEGGGFPKPTGDEYDMMDEIASNLPNIIDAESKQQVDDYRQACDGGKGPMVACFATAEYLSLFERKHAQAAELYRNTCFRPATDKSPNGVLVDKTKAYPPGCYNLANMLMTGKGRTTFDRGAAYQIFDRACRGGHGGACHLQAKMLASPPGELGPDIPYDPSRAAALHQKTCDGGDPVSCFTLAMMLLRGDHVAAEATNVTPHEARGLTPIQIRENEADRRKQESDRRLALKRDPPRAEQLLRKACLENGHGTACHNLVVMYMHGDDGVPANPEKAKEFQKKVEDQLNRFGGF